MSLPRLLQALSEKRQLNCWLKCRYVHPIVLVGTCWGFNVRSSRVIIFPQMDLRVIGKNTLEVFIVISRSSSIITILNRDITIECNGTNDTRFQPSILACSWTKKAQRIQPVAHQNIHDPKHGPMLKSFLVAFFSVSAYHGRAWYAIAPSISLVGRCYPKALKSSSVRIISVSKCFASTLTILQAFVARIFGYPSSCRPRIQKNANDATQCNDPCSQ